MGRIATTLVVAAVLAVPQAAAKPGAPAQLLGFIGQGRAWSVAKLDALSLQPISKTVPAGAAEEYVARSPGRGLRVALSTSSAALRFLDLKRMRWEFSVRYPGVPQASLWSYANRLVTLTGGADVIVVDPTKRRIGYVRSIDGSLGAHVTTRDRIIALVAPVDGIGPARLAVVDDMGHVRTAPLPQISAGSETLDNASFFRFEWPTLAVDERGAEAVVISSDGTIVDVRLDTLVSTVHVARSLAAVHKNATGSTRTAQWIGSTTIAVTGSDAAFDGAVQHSTPARLTLIDTRDWSARRIDADAVSLTFNGVSLLAFGDRLAGYDPDGALRFSLFEGTAPRPACIAGSYAYFGSGTHYTIVDTLTGTVVRSVETKTPTILAAFASYKGAY
jgi:hypothetical protein